ncbi:MAG: HU family DNA-binding protein [Actinomycetota bacterium]|nr:HU family DNA-binding protein [Actinomycetota bacterium]
MATKAEFIQAVAGRLDGDRKAATAAVDSVIKTIYAHVAKGEPVRLTGFGTFERRTRSARTGRNPRTGEAVKVKKTNTPAFRAGAEFKDIASGAKKPEKVVAAKKTAATKTTAAKRTAPARRTSAMTTAAPARKSAARATASKTPPAKKTTSARKSTAATKAPTKRTAAKKSAAKRSSASAR